MRVARFECQTAHSRKTHTAARSRRIREPGFASCVRLLRKIRGRREGRASGAPAASYAKVESIRVSHHRYAERTGLPCAMVLRFPSCSSRRSGFLSPSSGAMPKHVADLMPASRHQNHTTSPSACLRSSVASKGVHRFPPLTFVTIAKRPSDRGGIRIAINLRLPRRQAQFRKIRNRDRSAAGDGLREPLGIERSRNDFSLTLETTPLPSQVGPARLAQIHIAQPG